MKFILKYTFLITVCAFMCACNSNNGDIGSLYGIWRVENVTLNGEDVDLNQDGALLYTWSFQNSTFEINENLPHQEGLITLATWRREDKFLILDFDNTQSSGDNNVFTPPAIFGFKYGEQCKLEFLEEKGSKMELKYETTSGDTYIYKLKKTR